MPKYLINKIFIEARYNNSLLFNDMKYVQEIVDGLSSVMPNYNYDTDAKALMLGDNESRLKVTVTNNRLVIDFDEAESLECFRDKANVILGMIVEKLSIRSFVRVGMRALRGIEVKDINTANMYVRKNFIKISDNEMINLGDTKDIRVGFNSTYKNYILSLNISPNIFQVIEVRNGEVIKSNSIAQVLVDSDVFIENNISSSSIIESFIDDVIQCNYNCVDEFIRKVSKY